MTRRRKSVGMFTTDRALVVQTWDPWLAEVTGVPETAACGEPLARLYPSLFERGLLARLRRVADGQGVEVLAPALHKFLLPCPPRERDSRFEHMRQHVTIAPLLQNGAVAGVTVTIEDVTARFDRERRLSADLDSSDESVRWRAVQALAAGGESPALLSSALTDQSWRIRRAAAEGIAAVGSHSVIDTLIGAVRENHRDPALLSAALMALTHTTADVVLDLARLLESDDPESRMYAALALGLIGNARAVDALVSRLDDEDTNVRFHVIEALGRIGDHRPVEALAAIAESRDFFLAFAALDALAGIGDSSVAQRLVPLLDDEMLLPAVATCLGAIGSEDVVTPLASVQLRQGAPSATIAVALSNIYNRIEETVGEGALVSDLARRAMTRASADALLASIGAAGAEDLRGIVLVLSWLPFDGVDTALCELLRREDIRALAADRLVARGSRAVDGVESIASSDSDGVRRAAAFVLGRIGSARSVPILIDMLRAATSSDVAAEVCRALGAIGDERALAPLLEILDHNDPGVRQAAVSAINSLGHPRTEANIALRLHDDSPRVRESAARVAGYFGYGSCLRQMVELCEDADALVRRAAIESLASYDERAAWSKIRELVRADEDATVRAAAARALGRSPTVESLNALLEASRDSNLWVRYYVARAFGAADRPHADAIAALAVGAMRDSAPPVRIACIESLGALGAASMADLVISLTRDADGDVALAAVAALGGFDGEACAGALMDALNNADPARQSAAIDALARQRRPAARAVTALGALARDTTDRTAKRQAVRALGAIGNETAVAELVSLAGDHHLGPAVTEALARLGEEQLARLASAMATAPEAPREVVVEAVARTKHPVAARLLAQALTDASPRVRLAAARGLGRLDLRNARGQLDIMARTDESPAVRQAAQGALSRG